MNCNGEEQEKDLFDMCTNRAALFSKRGVHHLIERLCVVDI